MNVFSLRYLNTKYNSSLVFITIGPHHTMGLLRGSPNIINKQSLETEKYVQFYNNSLTTNIIAKY